MSAIRKRNRLPNWDYGSEGMYFITICTVNKQCSLGQIIVGDDAHIVPQIRLSAYGKIAERFLRTVPGMIQYCIMPNHIHALIQVSADAGASGPMWASAPTKGTPCAQSIPQRIRSFKALVTKTCGKALFQRSFYDHIVRDEADFLRICAYMDNNPAKWEEDKYYIKEIV